MTDSEFALSIDVSKLYFIELVNSFIKDLRFNTSLDIKAIGELEIFLDSFQVIEIQTIDDHLVVDISTIVKIISERRTISLAGLARSEVNFTLKNNSAGDLTLIVEHIEYDWKGLKTSVNGTSKKGVDNLAKTVLNLAENTISNKLADYINSLFTDLQKPYSFNLSPLNILDTSFRAAFHASELFIGEMGVDINQLKALVNVDILSNVKDEDETGELKIDKISLVESQERFAKEFNALINVSLSDIFVNRFINRYIKTLIKDEEFSLEFRKVILSADDGIYKVQLETDNRAAELIEFDMAFLITEFSNFPEVELDAFKIQGKGIVGVLAKQFLRIFKRKLDTLLSEKWLDFISSKIIELKSKGMSYQWKELNIHAPINDIEIVSLVISHQTGIELTAKVSTGIITISN